MSEYELAEDPLTKKQVKSQKDRIIEYIEEYGSIDRKQAHDDLGIFELSARITDLKRDGIHFKKETVTAVSKLGYPYYYKRYTLAV